MRIAMILLTVLVSTAAVSAEVYKWVSPDGVVHFSDAPHEGAETVDIPPIQIVPATRLDAQPSTQGKRQGPSESYRRFVFISPQNDQAIRSNNGSVQVSMALEPPLKTSMGHRLIVSLDGTPMGGTPPMSFLLPGLTRGTHTLAARVENAKGTTVIESDTVAFHVLRVHQ